MLQLNPKKESIRSKTGVASHSKEQRYHCTPSWQKQSISNNGHRRILSEKRTPTERLYLAIDWVLKEWRLGRDEKTPWWNLCGRKRERERSLTVYEWMIFRCKGRIINLVSSFVPALFHAYLLLLWFPFLFLLSTPKGSTTFPSSPSPTTEFQSPIKFYVTSSFIPLIALSIWLVGLC